MRKYHICLKALTFQFSRLIINLSKAILFTFPYYEAQIKSRGFSFRQENEGYLRRNSQIDLSQTSSLIDVLFEPHLKASPRKDRCKNRKFGKKDRQR